MKTILTAAKLLLVMTLLTGVAYPLLITAVANLFFSHQARGSLLYSQGKAIGSEMIAQKFVSNRYIWSRPSAIDYNPFPSGGSNLGPTSAILKADIARRRTQLAAAHEHGLEIPADLLYASASGLDPDVSPEAARYQVDRIIAARGLDPDAKNLLNNLIDICLTGPSWGFIGDPRVNVLKLNLLLDSLARKNSL